MPPPRSCGRCTACHGARWSDAETRCETYGLQKQGGTKFTYNHARGYHPLLAVMAGTGDVVHCRQRGGNANSGRGAASF